MSYAYDFGGRLVSVTAVNGGVRQYTYDTNNQMLTIQDALGNVTITNQYDTAGRVIQQTTAEGGTYLYTYTLDANGNIVQTDLTDPRGNIRRLTFGTSGYFSGGYLTSETYALGQPEQQTRTYLRDGSTNVLLSTTDSLGRTTSYVYDAVGNATSITRLSGTPEAVTTRFTYDPNFNRPTTVSDPLNHTTHYYYDNKGNLTSITDPLNKASTFTYNAAGQPTSATGPLDPLQDTTVYEYTGADLTAVTTPLGDTTRRVFDAGGRMISVTNPLGATTRNEYDSLGRLWRITNPLGAATTFTYDAQKNLLTRTDARDGLTRYSYDSMNRLTSQTDPLLRVESYHYDLAGLPATLTDRKGQVTAAIYDALKRLKQLTYADGSTIIYTYDAGNRMIQVTDSLSGTISRTYDNLDRLTSETTPQGAISYTYDAAGRRTSMTVAGQLIVTYTYDDADHLTAISQGSSTVAIAYDASGRRTSLALPNSVTAEYGYDKSSRIIIITYKKAATVIGTLTYSYDAAGNRTQTGGTYARTSLPAPVSSATYDAANQLTNWGTMLLAYDANGNLISDGTNTYSWDARNRLASVSGAISATFHYDALGRRIRNAAGTTLLYDGFNVVQELSGATVTGNILSSLGLDGVLTRTDPTGTFTLLADAQDSTLALLDSTGTVTTQYNYEPFGKTLVTGTASSNTVQYTGRENDGTGLYYYRARYYSPIFHRFLSEDPIGYKDGPNVYAYVGNSPVDATDPTGLKINDSCKNNPDFKPDDVSKGIQEAFDRVLKTDCIKNDDLKKKVLKKLEKIDVDCNSNLRDKKGTALCGQTVPLFGNGITLGLPFEKGECGPFGMTILHEVLHKFWPASEERSYACDKSCFPEGGLPSEYSNVCADDCK